MKQRLSVTVARGDGVFVFSQSNAFIAWSRWTVGRLWGFTWVKVLKGLRFMVHELVRGDANYCVSDV
jgi:hypothetical protein